jgi:gamma-glutamylcyclotransferase (GGCT)/AIG2-like uncharacterized protein YtfP
MPLLFTYGTLQLPQVQTELFGRLLNGYPDILSGYKQEQLILEDPTVLRLSQSETHLILEHTGNPKDQVSGMTYELTAEELQRADTYETDDYRRELVTFLSGKDAWVYVR